VADGNVFFRVGTRFSFGGAKVLARHAERVRFDIDVKLMRSFAVIFPIVIAVDNSYSSRSLISLTAQASWPSAKKISLGGTMAARKVNKAFMKPLQPSAALAEVVGSKALPRTEVTKKLWAYIKKNKLQDSKNRRNINADDTLKEIFGKKTVNMFEMTKLVGKHLK
jgi:chromatin remodeling complex protein RSC6